MQALLSFDQSPPISAPLRFLLVAPWFGALAGVVLVVDGPDFFFSRWSSAALAVTHLLVLGFLMQVMLGALIQILPVVAGANVARPEWVATVTQIALVLGTSCLAGGFYSGQSPLLDLGAGLLLSMSFYYLLATGRALKGVPSTSPTIRGLKLALFGLAGVALLGGFLVLALERGTTFSLLGLVDLHAGWGLGGWSGVLLVSVAYVVVPMFQLTPGYPARAGWFFPVAILIVLVLWTLFVFFRLDNWVPASKALLALLAAGFCCVSFFLQSKRRRAKVDILSRYWKLGLLSGILVSCMMLTAAIWPAWSERDVWSFIWAIGLIVGAFMSFIIGMLYKIIPFLAWLHLQNRGRGMVAAPTMSKMLSEKAMIYQYDLHVLSLLCLLAAAFAPEWFARLAGVMFVLNMGALGVNLLIALRNYVNFGVEIDSKLKGTDVPGT